MGDVSRENTAFVIVKTFSICWGREDTLWCFGQGCQFRFGRCFVFLIGMKCFSFGVFQRAISGFYCSYIYIYIYSTNIIQIQDKLNINYAIQTQCQTNIILNFKIFLNSQD